MQFETFAPLTEIPGIVHYFTLRDPADDTKSEDFESQLAARLGINNFARAEQVHGIVAAIIDTPAIVAGADALITKQRNLALFVRCADCAPVFIVDKTTPAIAVVHSGKKGTLGNVVGNTIMLMKKALGVHAENCRAFIGPSIGPCHYEMDIWSAVESQLRDAGVSDIHNPRTCTACNLSRYYSYRAEKGHTGRMFGVLMLKL